MVEPVPERTVVDPRLATVDEAMLVRDVVDTPPFLTGVPGLF